MFVELRFILRVLCMTYKLCTTVSIGLIFFSFFSLFFFFFFFFLNNDFRYRWVGLHSVLPWGNGVLTWNEGESLTLRLLSLKCLSWGTTSVKEECHPWLWSPPSHSIPSRPRVTPLELSHLLFSRRVAAALLPLLQVRGIGLAASSGHEVTPGLLLSLFSRFQSTCPGLWFLPLPRWALGLWS